MGLVFENKMAVARLKRFIDIGANLTDPMFQGKYHGKKVHQADFDDVLQRSYDAGLTKIIVTGGSLKDCRKTLALTSSDERLYTTVGCHPTRCGEFEKATEPDIYLKNLLELIHNNRQKVVAIGECGLDYDRLFFCEKELQLKYFELQMSLVEDTGLPLFLHCRNAFKDFFDVLTRNRGKLNGGVVHSFTGTIEEAKIFVENGYFIGLNGCSLKTEDNLKAVQAIPTSKMLLETDCPWCEIKPTHASFQHVSTHFEIKKKEKWQKGCSVKGRCEPRNIVQVLEAVSAVKGVNSDELAEEIYSNTCKLFKLS